MDILELKDLLNKRGSNVVLATNVSAATANKVSFTIKGIGLIGSETTIVVVSCIPIPPYLELEDIGTVRAVNISPMSKETVPSAIARYNADQPCYGQVRFFSPVRSPKPQEN